MEEMGSTHQRSRFGDGFALLPFGDSAREGKIARWPDSLLSVFTILISFENKKTRKSFPCFDTISALAGISKSSIGDAVGQLQQLAYLEVGAEDIGRGRKRNIYTMQYAPYSASCGGGDGRGWISVYDNVIKSGVWAVMSPAARKLYLVMKAFTMEGFYANTGWASSNTDAYADARCDCAEDFDFMPVSIFNKFGKELPILSTLCGIADRTYRGAKNWLTDNGLMLFYEGDYCAGLAFPHKPNKYAPKVLEALDNMRRSKDEAARSACTGHAKKSLRAIKARSQQVGRRGGDSRLGRSIIKLG